jgi:trehalose-6-phosphate synthase
VNPFDVAETATAIAEALEMSEEERVRRARGMGRAVLARNPVRWLTTQLRDLDAAAGITSQGPQEGEESGWPLHEEIGGTQ